MKRSIFYAQIAHAARSQAFICIDRSGQEVYEPLSPRCGRIVGIFGAAIGNGYRLSPDEIRFGMRAGTLRRQFFPITR